MSGPMFPTQLIATGAYSSSAGTITGTPVVWRNAPWFASVEARIAVAPTSSNAVTLDVYVQHSVDYLLAGPASSNFAANWDDFMHLPQITGGAGGVSQIGAWTANVAPSSSLNMHAVAKASLAAGQVIHGPLGAAWRVQAVIAGTSPVAASSSAWNFQVVAQGYE